MSVVRHAAAEAIASVATSQRGASITSSAARNRLGRVIMSAAAVTTGAATPLAAEAAALYALYVAAGEGGVDFSGIIRMIRGG